MKERPILFSTPMVIEVLNDAKDVTRRTKGLDKLNENPDAFSFNGIKIQVCRIWNSDIEENPNPLKTFFVFESNDGFKNKIKCPFGDEGDILWVRESWAHGSDSLPYIYKAGYPDNIPKEIENIPAAREIRWKPSIHMPKVACRLRIEIIKITPERLLDITDVEAIREGVVALSPVKAFSNLWDSINGKGEFKKNPWVWRIEFKVVSTTGKENISHD